MKELTTDEKYMQRCIQLASNGRGQVKSNPMVGAVVVCNDKIIGEGYHRKYGENHAEVNAINSVKDKSLLKKSTLYVSLEPCSHYGKTPPCSQLIIDNSIPRVVVACLDPFPEVSGKGVKMLQNAGVLVETGVLEEKAVELNKEFITAQLLNRPYIYLKWAQSQDIFIDIIRHKGDNLKPILLSNSFSSLLVHQRRAYVSAISVGTNTAILDNPSLTTRLWYGENPTRILYDREGKVAIDSNIFNNRANTILFTENSKTEISDNLNIQVIKFDSHLLSNSMKILKDLGHNSILIEGGAKLLQSFIDERLWDEALIETTEKILKKGITAPEIEGEIKNKDKWGDSTIEQLIAHRIK